MKLLIAFALWFCFCFAAMANTCEWTPAHNVYTGNAKDAIMSFTDIPLDVRQTLIERANAKLPEYSDVLTISKTAIIGRNSYLPDISKMHFGSSGRMCDSVSRTGWTDTQTQGAIAFCESGYCVIRPAVCNNWSEVTIINKARPFTDTSERIGRDESIPFLGYGEPFYVLPGIRGDWLPVQPLQAPPADTLTPWSVPDSPAPLVFSPLPVNITPSVPEPSTWLLFLVGGLIAWLYVLRKRN